MRQKKKMYTKPETDIMVFVEEDIVITSDGVYDADSIENAAGGIIDVF